MQCDDICICVSVKRIWAQEGKTLSPFEHKDVLLVIAACAFLHMGVCNGYDSPVCLSVGLREFPATQPSEAVWIIMASDAFHYLLTKVKCSQHVICPKWPCSQALLLA